MSNAVNTVPPVADKDLIKTLAFPFQKGPSGFPALAIPENYTFVNIVALIMTGVGERVMNAGLGVNVYEYVFDNMTPIQRVRLSNTIANAIETFIPKVRVNSVIPGEKKYQDGRGTSIVFDIAYTVGGQTKQQQVVYPPTAQAA